MRSVKGTIADGLGNMIGVNCFDAFQIRDRAAYFEDAVVGAGGEADALHGALEHALALGIYLAMNSDHPRSHRGVTEDALVAEAL